MIWSDLVTQVQKYKGAIWLNTVFPRFVRKIVFVLSSGVFFVTIFLSLPMVRLGGEVVYGIFFINASLWIFIFMIEMYVRSYYFAGLKDRKKTQKYTYEVADMILTGEGNDVAKGLFLSELGDERILRLGIKKQDVEFFFKNRHKPVASHIVEYTEADVTPSGLAGAVLDYDAELKEFLAGYGITPQMTVGAFAWVSKIHMQKLSEEEWWSREQLSRIPGIGKSWSQGISPTLDRFADDLKDISEYQNISDALITEKAVDDVEAVLSRSNSANVLLVGSDQQNMLSIVSSLGKRIDTGKAYPEIEHKRIKVLYHDRLFAEAKDASSLESVLQNIFVEAVRAEEIIIVIRDMNGFIEQAHEYKVDVVELMRPYISSPLVQIIGLVEQRVFEMNMRTNTTILGLFDHVSFSEKDLDDSLLLIVEQDATLVEKKVPVRFTYAAVHALAEQVKRLYSGAEQLTRVHTILSELALKAKNEKHNLVTKNDVEDVLHVKTGVPGSLVSQEEKTKLLDLEELLHVRVVGQEDAIRSISDALRKKRSGIGNPNKPIGSFLFLGPTGVGKTETARSLADVFFGSESDMIRFDMTEYSGTDSLQRLLGDYKINKPGILVSKLRERPYSLLLLDEFEKASQDVHDLFLQILDEGVFSDMKGEQINARNTIIIATSNAGSDLIWKMMSEKMPMEHIKEAVINETIEKQIFRPELLNRFDGTIVFHPLLNTHLNQVAERMLQKLSERLKEQGYHLSYDKDLVARLVQIGSDPKFGARPIARAIGERVEGAIARQILQGKIKTGDTVHISAADLV